MSRFKQMLEQAKAAETPEQKACREEMMALSPQERAELMFITITGQGNLIKDLQDEVEFLQAQVRKTH